MAQHFKVHELLSASQLEELEKFAREPGRTFDEVHEWMLAAGCTIGRTACGNWMREFQQKLMAERFSGASELAKAIKDGVSQGNFGDIADAAVMQLVQVIFEQAAKMPQEGQVKSGDLLNMAIALKSTIGSKEQLTKLLAQKFDQEMAKTTARKDGRISADDIAAARKAIFGF